MSTDKTALGATMGGDSDFTRALSNAPPQPSSARPFTITEDAARWHAYWLEWFVTPTTTPTTPARQQR